MFQFGGGGFAKQYSLLTLLTKREFNIAMELWSLQNSHLDTSLVFGTALKILEAKAGRELSSCFWTHHPTIAKVGLERHKFLHRQRARIYLPSQPEGRRGCLTSLTSATSPPTPLPRITSPPCNLLQCLHSFCYFL